jgi:hypothetical protein
MLNIFAKRKKNERITIKDKSLSSIYIDKCYQKTNAENNNGIIKHCI